MKKEELYNKIKELNNLVSSKYHNPQGIDTYKAYELRIVELMDSTGYFEKYLKNKQDNRKRFAKTFPKAQLLEFYNITLQAYNEIIKEV